MVAGLLFTVSCYAQTNNSKAQTPGRKWLSSLYNITETGMLCGSETGIYVKTVLGYRFLKQYSVGIGVGIQDYFAGERIMKERTDGMTSISAVPVFLDLRYDFLPGKITPFVYGNAGLSHPWSMKLQWRNEQVDKKYWGDFYEAGLGGKFRWNKRNALLVSAGYQYSQAIGKNFNTAITPIGQDIWPERIEYNFSRISLAIGLTF